MATTNEAERDTALRISHLCWMFADPALPVVYRYSRTHLNFINHLLLILLQTLLAFPSAAGTREAVRAAPRWDTRAQGLTSLPSSNNNFRCDPTPRFSWLLKDSTDASSITRSCWEHTAKNRWGKRVIILTINLKFAWSEFPLFLQLSV